MKIRKALSFISFNRRLKVRAFFFTSASKLACLFIFIFCSQLTHAQVNLSGKSGLMYIPNATANEDASLSFGYNYNPLKYSLRSKKRNAERVLFANLTVLPRLTITVSLLQPVTTDPSIKEGLGDRQLDISYLLVKEKPKFPSVAVIISSPFMIETAMLTNVLVATKHFNLNNDLNLETTAGYGSPYILSREGDFKLNLSNSNIFSNLKFQKKSDFIFNNGYLVGPFAGLKLGYKNKAGVMTEWDSQHLNVGAYVTLWKSWTIQGGLLNGDRFIFGSSIHFQLLKPKKSIAKLDEKLN